jgi:hypothetical protein
LMLAKKRQPDAQLPSARVFVSCLENLGNISGYGRLKFARLSIQCFEFLIQLFKGADGGTRTHTEFSL